MFSPNKRLAAILLTVTSLLLLPLIAMQFTSEVNWTLSDFVVAGFLLFSTGLLCEFVLRKFREKTYRLVICGGLLALLCLVWLELAVGIFGSPISGH